VNKAHSSQEAASVTEELLAIEKLDHSEQNSNRIVVVSIDDEDKYFMIDKDTKFFYNDYIYLNIELNEIQLFDILDEIEAIKFYESTKMREMVALKNATDSIEERFLGTSIYIKTSDTMLILHIFNSGLINLTIDGVINNYQCYSHELVEKLKEYTQWKEIAPLKRDDVLGITLRNMISGIELRLSDEDTDTLLNTITENNKLFADWVECSIYISMDTTVYGLINGVLDTNHELLVLENTVYSVSQNVIDMLKMYDIF
jgi:hypothetical protein